MEIFGSQIITMHCLFTIGANVEYMASWGLNVLTFQLAKKLINSTNIANWNKPPLCYIQCCV